MIKRYLGYLILLTAALIIIGMIVHSIGWYEAVITIGLAGGVATMIMVGISWSIGE